MDDAHIVFDFNYAIDASWDPPDPSFAPDYPPEAFPLSANSAEAYLITVTDTGSTAWYVDAANKGGSLLLDIEIFDWQALSNPFGVPGELTGLWLEGEVVDSPVDLLTGALFLPGGETSSVIETEIVELDLTGSGPMNIWIIAENADPNKYEPNIEGLDTSPWTWCESPLAAYLRTTVLISGIEPQNAPEVIAIDPDEGNVDSIVPVTITGNHFVDGCQVELRESDGTHVIEPDNELWVDATEITCDLDLTGVPLGLYDVVVINPSTLEGSLDEGFEVLHGNIIYVDDSNTSGVEDGTMAHPYNTIQEGLAAASAGYEVWVDDSGVDYTGPITLTPEVLLKSVNWHDADGDDEATISLSGTDAVVNGAEGATIDGFKITGSQRIGIDINEVSTTVSNCHITSLTCSAIGEDAIGINVTDSLNTVIQNCEVSDILVTQAFSYAIGIMVTNKPETVIQNMVIQNCEVSDIVNTSYNGGCYGIQLVNTPATITDTEVHNIGDISYSYSWVGCIFADGCNPHGDSKLDIRHCSLHAVAGNHMTQLRGLYIKNCSEISIFNNLVYDIHNVGDAYNIYGIFVHLSTDVEIQNNVIHDLFKDASMNDCVGLWMGGCTNINTRNTIISSIHSTSGDAYGVFADYSMIYTFEYNNVYDCTTDEYWAGASGGIGCIYADPLFVNPGTDFHLDSGPPASPCIDTGDPSILDPDSSTSDMGAYGGPGGDW